MQKMNTYADTSNRSMATKRIMGIQLMVNLQLGSRERSIKCAALVGRSIGG